MTDRTVLRDRRIYVVFSITIVAVMGVASLTPALPMVSAALHLSKAQVGLLISSFTFPGVILTPFTGVIADRWGRKIVLVPSLFLFAVAGFSIFFVRDFHLMILLRVLQGIGAASLGAMNTTLIGDFFKGRDLPAAMGFNASVLSLSTASYPLLGGALAGIAWYYPFILPILALPVGIFVIYGIPEPEFEKAADLRQYLSAATRSILKREVMAIFTLGVLTFIILYGAFLTYLPFLLDSEFQLTPPQIGILFSLSSLTTAVLSSRVGALTRRFGSLNLLRTAYALYFIVILIMPAIHHLPLFVLPVLLFGSAQALNIPSLQTLLASMAPSSQRAAFMSLNGMILRFGQTLGPLIIGLGYSWNGLNGAFHLAAAVAFIGLAVLFTLHPDRLPSDPRKTE